jgi:cytochrome c553
MRNFEAMINRTQRGCLQVLRILGMTAVALLVTAAHGQGAAPAKAEVCVACHGTAGQSTQPQYPILAGQTSRYLYLQLRDFQEGRRSDPAMSPMVAGLSRDELRELADYFAKQTPRRPPFQPDAEKARLGKLKADETLCTMCHLGGFMGQNEIPRVAGQHYEYVVKQLREFKARKRTNDAGNMTSVSNTLSDADIENLGHYLAGL